MSPPITWRELVEQGAIQLAERIRDLPEPYVPSQRRRCSRCGRAVWISNGAIALADQLTIVCRPCLEGQLNS